MSPTTAPAPSPHQSSPTLGSLRVALRLLGLPAELVDRIGFGHGGFVSPSALLVRRAAEESSAKEIKWGPQRRGGFLLDAAEVDPVLDLANLI